MSDVDVYLVNVGFNWLFWAVLAWLTVLAMELRFGRNITVVHTWVEAFLSWIFWSAITSAVIAVASLTEQIPPLKIGLPGSLSEWVILAGSLLIYFSLVVSGIKDLKAKVSKEEKEKDSDRDEIAG